MYEPGFVVNIMRVRVISDALLLCKFPLQCNARLVVTDYMLSGVPAFMFECITSRPGELRRTHVAAFADSKS